MPTLRVRANYLLWRMGRRQVLPRHYIARVPIRDCGEPLEAVMPVSGRIVLDTRLDRPHIARRSVIEALRHAAELLPDGLQLLLIEAHRSVAAQQELWDTKLNTVTDAHLRSSSEEIERLTRLAVARPGLAGGGHQSGGAVDLTLATDDGAEVWMGTKVAEFVPAVATAAQVDNIARQHRNTLTKVMIAAGFVNYPAEWWHFSLGDQLWAAYGRHSRARYGPIELNATEILEGNGASLSKSRRQVG